MDHLGCWMWVGNLLGDYAMRAICVIMLETRIEHTLHWDHGVLYVDSLMVMFTCFVFNVYSCCLWKSKLAIYHYCNMNVNHRITLVDIVGV